VKRLLVVLAALVLVGTSACIRSESSQGVQAGGKPITEKTLPPCPLGALKTAKGTVNVELWEAFVGQAKEYINQLADDFNKSQSKVHVEVRSQGDSYDELLQKFQAELASKQLPAIALVEDQNLRVMVDTGAVLPAESCQRADQSDFPVLPAVRNYYSGRATWTCPSRSSTTTSTTSRRPGSTRRSRRSRWTRSRRPHGP
jgi:ABC-type glycerol-3-phosphate transport system substrate-binding protein